MSLAWKRPTFENARSDGPPDAHNRNAGDRWLWPLSRAPAAPVRVPDLHPGGELRRGAGRAPGGRGVPGRADARPTTCACATAHGRTSGSVGRPGGSVGRPAGREIGHAVGRSVRRSVGRSRSRMVGRSVGRAIGHAVGQSVRRTVGRAVGRAIGRSVGRGQPIGRSAVGQPGCGPSSTKQWPSCPFLWRCRKKNVMRRERGAGRAKADSRTRVAAVQRDVTTPWALATPWAAALPGAARRV